MTVFVIHGRNEALRKSMFDFLRAIGLKPLEWSQAVSATGEGSPYVGQVLDKAFSIAQAVVVLMTPDDWAWLKKEFHGENEAAHETEPTGQARANVIFEAGMSMGRNARRTMLVEVGSLRPFSDVGGRHVLRMNDSPERRHDLVDRLKSAGCPVDTTGRDWLKAGSFELGHSHAETPHFAEPRPKDPIRAYAYDLRNSPSPNLAQDELDLISSATDGFINVGRADGYGRMIMNAGNFFDEKNPSVQARFLDALDRLLAGGLIRADGADSFRLTGRGFQVFDSLKASSVNKK
jgi:hypothetical protein